MSELLITIHNVQTGQIETRPMNSNELAEVAERNERFAVEEIAAQAKKKTRADLLAKLGITEEEVKALLG